MMRLIAAVPLLLVSSDLGSTELATYLQEHPAASLSLASIIIILLYPN